MGARGRFVKLLIDENLPIVIVELARRQEIEASWVRDELPGAPDLKILERLESTGEALGYRLSLLPNPIAGPFPLPGFHR